MLDAQHFSHIVSQDINNHLRLNFLLHKLASILLRANLLIVLALLSLLTAEVRNLVDFITTLRLFDRLHVKSLLQHALNLVLQSEILFEHVFELLIIRVVVRSFYGQRISILFVPKVFV